MDRVVGEVDRLSDGGEDAIDRSQCILWRRVTVDQDPEVVSAKAGTGVCGADRGAQAARDLLEDLIARRLAEHSR